MSHLEVCREEWLKIFHWLANAEKELGIFDIGIEENQSFVERLERLKKEMLEHGYGKMESLVN